MIDSAEYPWGQLPVLEPGMTWDRATDRIHQVGRDPWAAPSWAVRRPGMCGLCPRGGRLLAMGCIHEHVWQQILCDKHARRCHRDGDVNCMACWGSEWLLLADDDPTPVGVNGVEWKNRPGGRRQRFVGLPPESHWCDVLILPGQGYDDVSWNYWPSRDDEEVVSDG
jgi:hypothetical protein